MPTQTYRLKQKFQETTFMNNYNVPIFKNRREISRVEEVNQKEGEGKGKEKY